MDKQKITNYETEDFTDSIMIEHHTTTRKFYSGMHIHVRFYEMYVFLNGNVDYFVENTKKHLERGDLLIVSPNELHRPYINDNSSYERVVIHVTGHTLLELSTPQTNLLKEFQKIKSHFFHFSEEELEFFLENEEKVRKYKRDSDFLGSDILMQSYLNIILLQILNKLLREKEIEKREISCLSPLIFNVVEYINQHFMEDLTVQSIAEEFNVSRSYLSHLFGEYMGSSVWNYVLSKRLALAQKLILEGKSITEVCYETGFRDYTHFIKTFTKTFNVSPKQYRIRAINQFTAQLPM